MILSYYHTRFQLDICKIDSVVAIVVLAKFWLQMLAKLKREFMSRKRLAALLEFEHFDRKRLSPLTQMFRS